MRAIPTLFLAALALATSTAAGEFQVGAIVIGQPWARPTPGAATPGVGYMTFENLGPDDDRLIAATSPAAPAVSMHRTEVTDGIASMRPQPDGIVVPAGGSVRLEPGGYHLMLEQLKKPLALGEAVPVSLTFATAGSVTVELKVERRPPTDDAGHGAH